LQKNTQKITDLIAEELAKDLKNSKLLITVGSQLKGVYKTFKALLGNFG